MTFFGNFFDKKRLGFPSPLFSRNIDFTILNFLSFNVSF